MSRVESTSPCSTCLLCEDCELEWPSEGKCPYFEPRERLRLTFTEKGWRMGQ